MMFDSKTDPFKDPAIAAVQRQASPSGAILGGFRSEPFYTDEEAGELAAHMDRDGLVDAGFFVLEPIPEPDRWPEDRPAPMELADLVYVLESSECGGEGL